MCLHKGDKVKYKFKCKVLDSYRYVLNYVLIDIKFFESLSDETQLGQYFFFCYKN